MKPAFEKVPLSQSSFLIKEEKFDSFDIPWHAHPEFELALIKRGSGKFRVANTLHSFDAQELFFFGPNLSHSWSSHDTGGEAPGVSQVIIQFPPDFLGPDWFHLIEFGRIKILLKRSSGGMSFFGETLLEASELIESMIHLNGFDRLMMLLRLLDLLSKSKQFRQLSNLHLTLPDERPYVAKLNNVYNYILTNYNQPLTLQIMADYTHMAPQSFSRYFKQSTRKSFSVFLNEVRIEQACRLICQRKSQISRICYEVGYNNVSNFNRQFKRMTGMSPREYLNEYAD